MNLEEMEKEIETKEESQPLQLSSDQAIETLNRILNKQMSQSEAELMRAENMELKKQLASFTTNYEKFAQLVMNTLQMHEQTLEREQIELKENLKKEQNNLQENVLNISNRSLQKVHELQNNSQILNQNLNEVMNTGVNKIMGQTLVAMNKTVAQLSEISERKINEINQITIGYKKEFEEYKEKTEKKTSYWEKRNNIRDLLFYISVFAMPVYVIIEVYLKFFAK